jgi:hypothetical protein
MNAFKLVFKSILYLILGGSILASLIGAVLGLLFLIGKVYSLLPPLIHIGLAWLFAGSIILTLSLMAVGIGYELSSAWKLKLNKRKVNKKGFTLIHLLAILAIIGVSFTLIGTYLLIPIYDKFIR